MILQRMCLTGEGISLHRNIQLRGDQLLIVAAGKHRLGGHLGRQRHRKAQLLHRIFKAGKQRKGQYQTFLSGIHHTGQGIVDPHFVGTRIAAGDPGQRQQLVLAGKGNAAPLTVQSDICGLGRDGKRRLCPFVQI